MNAFARVINCIFFRDSMAFLMEITSDDSDLWASDDSIEYERQLISKTSKRENEIIYQQGYREGRDFGEKSCMQKGFDDGFLRFSKLAFQCGLARHKKSFMESDKLITVQELFQRLRTINPKTGISEINEITSQIQSILSTK